MFDIVQKKLIDGLRLVAVVLRSEGGQTATEYVAITAVGVVIAISVTWVLLSDGLENAIISISSRIVSLVGTTGPP